MLKITEYVIAFSPVGICALMAKLVSTISGAMMKEVIIFVLTIDIVILIYGLIWYPLMLKFVAKLNVPRFFPSAQQASRAPALSCPPSSSPP